MVAVVRQQVVLARSVLLHQARHQNRVYFFVAQLADSRRRLFVFFIGFDANRYGASENKLPTHAWLSAVEAGLSADGVAFVAYLNRSNLQCAVVQTKTYGGEDTLAAASGSQTVH